MKTTNNTILFSATDSIWNMSFSIRFSLAILEYVYKSQMTKEDRDHLRPRHHLIFVQYLVKFSSEHGTHLSLTMIRSRVFHNDLSPVSVPPPCSWRCNSCTKTTRFGNKLRRWRFFALVHWKIFILYFRIRSRHVYFVRTRYTPWLSIARFDILTSRLFPKLCMRIYIVHDNKIWLFNNAIKGTHQCVCHQ